MIVDSGHWLYIPIGITLLQGDEWMDIKCLSLVHNNIFNIFN